jgi:hypothetical protein
VAGSCEHGRESSGLIKERNFFASSITIGFQRKAWVSKVISLISLPQS